MKYFVLLACLTVCLVSLPVTSRVAAENEVADEIISDITIENLAVSAAVADSEDATTKPADAESSDADADDDANDGEKPAAADDDAKAAAEPASEKKDAAKKKEAKSDDAEKKEQEKKRKTYKVKSKRVKVDVTLDGTFVADKMTEVALRPDAWSQFEIVEVVDHGSEVHAGEVLIKFDDEKINKEIDELELSEHLSELTIRKAEEELPRLDKTLAMTADDADRKDKYAKEDYDRYQKIDRPMILKSVEYSLKYAQFTLDYEQDELDQLDKMYEADDLTEETEEVILKRQRNSVDFAKFSLEQTKQYCEEILDVRLPRADIRVKQAVDSAALELARAKTSLALDLTRARFELEQQKQSRARSLDRHAELLTDRSLMEIKAPVDGIVYYGECEEGKWTGLSSMRSKLKPHNNASADSVLMTIVSSRPLSVMAQVGEDKRPDVAKGQRAKIVPPNDAADRLDAKLKSVSAAPVTTGKFAVEFDLTGSDVPEWIVPGLSCKVKVNTYDNADSLVAPKKAVHTDDYDEELKYVWLVDPDDDEATPKRHTVKLGKTSGDDVEIVKGLKQGDVISLDDEKAKQEKELEDAEE